MNTPTYPFPPSTPTPPSQSPVLNSQSPSTPSAKPHPAPSAKPTKLKKHLSRLKPYRIPIIIISIALLVGAIATVAIIYFNSQSSPSAPSTPTPSTKPAKPKKYYSALTGEEISHPDQNHAPTFCIQIPNGTDGPRPQVGLNQAAIIFEAIAEAGITRFAAIFQNPTSSAIGPIRSLRMYYLEWDIPFDCTIVHAGGSDDAIAAARSYRDLTESRAYMWRDYAGYYAPNNLFTSPALLNLFNSDHQYHNSNPVGFLRLSPKAAQKVHQTNLSASTKSEDPTPLVSNISINFGSSAAFNTTYVYDSTTNSYARSYANSTPHTSYTCPPDLDHPRPKQACSQPTQISPKVVIAMLVDQSTAWDNYHQNITTIGSDTAFIFQNGTAIKGTWSKSDRNSQIIFKDESGKPIPLTPGQTWISAVPKSTGSVHY